MLKRLGFTMAAFVGLLAAQPNARQDHSQEARVEQSREVRSRFEPARERGNSRVPEQNRLRREREPRRGEF